MLCVKYRIAFVAIALSVIVCSTFAQDKQQNQRRQRPAPFQQFFTLPGIEFSTEQQAKAEELRKEFIPKFIESQIQWDGVYSEEQQQTRRKAPQEARNAGKGIPELRDAVETEITLTQEQKERRAAIQKERYKLLEQIRAQLTSPLTDEQRAQLRRQGNRHGSDRSAAAPTHRDLKYGPHDRNVMDVWLAESDKPTPVLVSIHGGGFRGGNNSVVGEMLRLCLESGISVVAITRREFPKGAVGNVFWKRPCVQLAVRDRSVGKGCRQREPIAGSRATKCEPRRLPNHIGIAQPL